MSADLCDCPVFNPFTCWRSRHNRWDESREAVIEAGGPCKCSCHDGEDTYEDDQPWPTMF